MIGGANHVKLYLQQKISGLNVIEIMSYFIQVYKLKMIVMT